MDTETKLFATTEQARELIRNLKKAIKDAEQYGTMHYARTTLEQFENNGPWRLIIAVNCGK